MAELLIVLSIALNFATHTECRQVGQVTVCSQHFGYGNQAPRTAERDVASNGH